MSIFISIYVIPSGSSGAGFQNHKKTRPVWEGASYAPQQGVKALYNRRTYYCKISCADYTIVDRGEIWMATKIDDMVSRMEQSRAQLNTAIDKVAPQTEIYPTWKVKQVMDHIAGWDELVYRSLLAYKNGDTPAPMEDNGIDRFNARSIADRENVPIEQSKREYINAREKVIQVLHKLPLEMLTEKYPAPWGGKCTISSIVRIFVSHEQEHAHQIEEVLMNAPASH
jgi:hypothetical protein